MASCTIGPRGPYSGMRSSWFGTMKNFPVFWALERFKLRGSSRVVSVDIRTCECTELPAPGCEIPGDLGWAAWGRQDLEKGATSTFPNSHFLLGKYLHHLEIKCDDESSPGPSVVGNPSLRVTCRLGRGERDCQSLSKSTLMRSHRSFSLPIPFYPRQT